MRLQFHPMEFSVPSSSSSSAPTSSLSRRAVPAVVLAIGAISSTASLAAAIVSAGASLASAALSYPSRVDPTYSYMKCNLSSAVKPLLLPLLLGVYSTEPPPLPQTATSISSIASWLSERLYDSDQMFPMPCLSTSSLYHMATVFYLRACQCPQPVNPET